MSDETLLAKGGGDATAVGVRFQAAVGAIILASVLAERPLDPRLCLGNSKPIWVRFETEAPIDDILVETDLGGFVEVQAKASLASSRKPESEFAKTVGQIVRQYLACRTGNGGRGWDRPNDPSRDRFLIAVGPKSSGTIRQYLAEGLRARGESGPGGIPPLSKNHNEALADFDACVVEAWNSTSSEPFTDSIKSEISKMTIILTFDIDGSDWAAASTILSTTLTEGSEREKVLGLLLGICLDKMATRSGADGLTFRRLLSQKGACLEPAEKFRADVKALKDYSARVQKALSRFEEIEPEIGKTIHISRSCQADVQNAAISGSFLLIGEPGSGKSAVINAATRDLMTLGYDVIEFAVDRLPVDSLDGLARELNLNHPLIEVLFNWEAEKPGYILIDALDATRGGVSKAVFRALISEIVLSESRWRIIASIRTFDLRLGQQLRSLFKGPPPIKSLADPSFSNVRHVQVPTWTSEEMETLLAQSPALANAMAHSPGKVKDLAVVPFNTRLLSELVSSGIKPEEFERVDTQVELLKLYWDHRVVGMGEAASVLLKRVVEMMVCTRALCASRIEVAENDPTTLQGLFRQGVLAPMENDRYVCFRHHLFFDYVASRVFFDPEKLRTGKMPIQKNDGLGLMLAPALTFLLRELWNSSDSHQTFWEAVVILLGKEDCDPVLRSVAARSASELTVSIPDIKFFADCVIANVCGSSLAVTHIVGALAVRLEDNEETEIAPWAAFAAQVSAKVDLVAWSVRTLSYLLIQRSKESLSRANLGIAARELLAHGFSNEGNQRFVESAIGFVADTFGTDPKNSRFLLKRVFEVERFSKFGSEEIPALARKVNVIAYEDPDFVVEVFREVYKKSVDDDRVTPIGNSQILSLTSNARQDFDMARYELGEFFPKFLGSHPEAASEALIFAVEGFVAREHSLQEEPEEIQLEVEGEVARLKDDLSYIWAADPDGKYRQDAEVLLVAFREKLISLTPEITIRIVRRTIQRNKLAVIWSRLFMAAARRPEVFGSLLGPFACKEPFLVSPDTRKDAIDLIAKLYAGKTVEDRRQFEITVRNFDFSKFSDPEKARTRFLTVLFCSIGIDHLVTSEAKALVPSEPNHQCQNDRPCRVWSSSGETEPYWWIKEAGVNLDSPENAKLREAIDCAKLELGINDEKKGGLILLPATMEALRKFEAEVKRAKIDNSAEELLSYAEGVFGEGLKKTAGIKELADFTNRIFALELTEWVINLAQSPFPRVNADTEANFEKSALGGLPPLG